MPANWAIGAERIRLKIVIVVDTIKRRVSESFKDQVFIAKNSEDAKAKDTMLPHVKFASDGVMDASIWAIE